MIIIRNVFRLKFGKAKEVKALIPDFIAVNKKHGVTNTRTLMDVTGESYTYIFETGHASLAEFESKLQSMFGAPEWKTLYDKFLPLVNSGYREIFTVIGE